MFNIQQRCGAGRRAARRRQRGGIAILFAVIVIVIIGFAAMALDLARMVNRKAELQSLAQSTVMVAAAELNGTAEGIASAQSKAQALAGTLHFNYDGSAVEWSGSALSFASSAAAADGAWMDGAAAAGAPQGLLYAKVDTAVIDGGLNVVDTLLMRVVSEKLTQLRSSGRAVAGRATIKVTPLAVCALSNTPAAKRTHAGASAALNLDELVEYGFRRGVSYDLMQLNPNAATPENFIVDPIDPLGAAGSDANLSAAVVAPYVCTGTMPMPTLSGGAITVGRPFPLAALYTHLNSRFDAFSGQCSVANAPPDSNIKAYSVPDNVSFMSTAVATRPAGQTAASTAANPLQTIADTVPTPTTNGAPLYGPLWSYAKAVPFGAYAAGTPEPAAGYATFAPSNWAVLYPGNAPAVSPPSGNYPSLPPYQGTISAYATKPSSAHGPGVKNRRVLNIPLLGCPLPAGARVAANIVAIGKFFMTVPATATSVPAEFAGIVGEDFVGGQIERKE